MKAKGRILVGAVVLLAVGGVATTIALKGRKKATPVALHDVGRADVFARVSCTGKIEAKKKVEISANVMGQIMNLAVKEGDRVHKGQFLLQIDRAQLQAQAQASEAGMYALLSEREAARATLAQAEDAFRRGAKNFEAEILSEADFERERMARDGARAALDASERRIEQARATLASSRDSLSKTTITAPIDGMVSALPVEEGEIAVIGTMNNAGTKLMTISDMSEIQAEMDVDETDVPRVQIGQKATLTIDALPGKTYEGKVTEIGSSPIVRTTNTNQAVEFSVKVVLDQPSGEIRPGFSVSGEIETGEKKGVVAIPVQALVVQDLAAKIAQQEKEAGPDAASTAAKKTPRRSRDVEGVYRVDDGKAHFVAVKTGLQGEMQIEVTEGLKPGDRIVTGPFRTLRTLKEGDAVRPEDKDKGKDGGAAGRS